VDEVPIAFRDRELGQSKMGTGVILTYFRRLLALSGWRESRDTIGLGIGKTLLVWAVDFGLFAAAWLLHGGLGLANLTGFAAGGMLNAWLKSAQLPGETLRRPQFLSRLAFVSLLSLFLRGGILGTCAHGLGWPWLAAIVPAIVAGWTVMFLGYALFIWPVREQYGSGVRWRVAAMGATAYLLALRVAYLYTMPVERRLAALPDATGGMSLGNRVTAGLRHGGVFLLGPDRAGNNVPALFCWALGAWAVFKGTQRVFDKTTAFRALLLFSVLPVFFFTGTVFGPETVLVTGWALLLWLIACAFRWNRGLAAVCGIIAAGLFWRSGGWLPWSPLPADSSGGMARLLLFIPWQAAMVTPVAIMDVVRFFVRRRAGERSAAGLAAAICAVLAGANALGVYFAGGLAITVSGALWLPLLPLVASEMQRPGCPPVRCWSPVIYGCVICYGLYFYWLAFLR
jgi:dolichol-phosphate mannosyltransferase